MVARMEAEPESQRCAGCGGKVGPDVLQAQLGARSQAGDVAPLNDQEVASVDLLRDGFDDPFLFGKVAAVHALSDLHAVGATNPRLLAALTLPYARSFPLSRDLEQVQAGLESAGVPVIGGHTAEGSELSAAVTVVGDTAATAGARTPETGDSLILTKPLGVGLILAARMVGRVLPQDVQAAFEHCEQDNAAACCRPRRFRYRSAHGCYGLRAAGTPAFEPAAKPWGRDRHQGTALLTGARDAFDAGVRPSILSGTSAPPPGMSPRICRRASALCSTTRRPAAAYCSPCPPLTWLPPSRRSGQRVILKPPRLGVCAPCPLLGQVSRWRLQDHGRNPHQRLAAALRCHYRCPLASRVRGRSYPRCPYPCPP